MPPDRRQVPRRRSRTFTRTRRPALSSVMVTARAAAPPTGARAGGSCWSGLRPGARCWSWLRGQLLAVGEQLRPCGLRVRDPPGAAAAVRDGHHRHRRLPDADLHLEGRSADRCHRRLQGGGPGTPICGAGAVASDGPAAGRCSVTKATSTPSASSGAGIGCGLRIRAPGGRRRPPQASTAQGSRASLDRAAPPSTSVAPHARTRSCPRPDGRRCGRGGACPTTCRSVVGCSDVPGAARSSAEPGCDRTARRGRSVRSNF